MSLYFSLLILIDLIHLLRKKKIDMFGALVVAMLSRILTRATERGLIQRLEIGKDVIEVSHLQLADDCNNTIIAS